MSGQLLDKINFLTLIAAICVECSIEGNGADLGVHEWLCAPLLVTWPLLAWNDAFTQLDGVGKAVTRAFIRANRLEK